MLFLSDVPDTASIAATAASTVGTQVPMRPEEAGPAADALFDVFQLAFSPVGLGLVIGIIV